MAPFANDCTAKPTTGRPIYVAGLVAVPPRMSVTIVGFVPSECTGAAAGSKKPMSSHPSWNPEGVVMLAMLAEPSTFELLNVTTLASQHSALVATGGGGEKLIGVDEVFSSRS